MSHFWFTQPQLLLPPGANSAVWALDQTLHPWSLQEILARHLGVSPADLTFAADPFGRPIFSPATCAQIPAAQNLDFNISHAGPLLAIALCAGGRIGVDVELLNQPHDLPALMGDVLTPAEQQWLSEQPPAQHAFLRLWTAKEAFGKALGQGIAQDLRLLELRPQGQELHIHRLQGQQSLAQGWKLYQQLLPTSAGTAILSAVVG